MSAAVIISHHVMRAWDIASGERLRALAQLPLSHVSGSPATRLYRDLYFDTPDRALRRLGLFCRFRYSADDLRILTLIVGAAQPVGAPARRIDVRIRAIDPEVALSANNSVTRRLRGVVDPTLLGPVLELAIARTTRRTGRFAPWRRFVVDFDTVTVRAGEAARSFHRVRACARGSLTRPLADLDRALSAAGAQPTRLSYVERAELLAKWMTAGRGTGAFTTGAGTVMSAAEATGPLDPELSFVASQHRVLALASDDATPLAERLRFAAIVAANMDEFIAVRVAGLKLGAPEPVEEFVPEDGPAPRLAAIAAAVRSLSGIHERVTARLLDAAAQHGTRVRSWTSLTARERAGLALTYERDVHPELTPFAMTLSPGHPIPPLDTLSLSLAVMLRGRSDVACHLAQVELPSSLPRLIPVVDGNDADHGFVFLEDLVRHHLHALYPAHEIEEVGCFRVTRGADLVVDEDAAEDLLVAVDDATRHRLRAAIVRVEVDRAMAPVLRELLLDELRRESFVAGQAIGADDVFEVTGPLDLRFVAHVPLPPDPVLRYPPFQPANPVVAAGSILDQVRDHDLLVHHPFEAFAGSVVRFIDDAAADEAVLAIKLTLYRAGDQSPVIDALQRAARAGKQVHAFVELRARFDEARNVRWVRTLERAGVHVVYGMRGVKTHAKVMLVVRRELGGIRRYVHVGTGNYNPLTAGAYTDLSLFTADAGVTSDIADLFNALTGATAPVAAGRHGVLMAPAQLLDALLERIARELAHARAGREASIRMKVNGLSDPDIVAALSAASQGGVNVSLVVRSICTLRPGVPGVTDRIRVVANTGRFLEHSRILHFGNGGSGEWFIGSPDLRTRNLRRRVELLVPVRDAEHQAALNRVLNAYLDDARGWELDQQGEYRRRSWPGPGAQDCLLAGEWPGVPAKVMKPQALSDVLRVDFTRGAH